jgi:hypothetical protein
VGVNPFTLSGQPTRPHHTQYAWREGVYDSQTGIPCNCSHGARCVQRLDDSQIHANRITFRISLRSSSLQEPRDPLLKVVHFVANDTVKHASVYVLGMRALCMQAHTAHNPNHKSPTHAHEALGECTRPKDQRMIC